MILDSIISVIASIVAALADVVLLAAIPLINLLIGAVEAIVGLFVTGFQLRRLNRRENTTATRMRNAFTSLMVLSVIVLMFFVAPAIASRQIALVSEDGHSLPFAAVILHKSGGNKHLRTDNAGNVTIPRFGLSALTIKDPRYIEKTWTKAEIGRELVVSRTKLGSALDVVADRLLAPAKR